MKKQQQFVIGGAAMIAGMAGVSAQDAAPLFKIGSVDVRPHAAYSIVYDDNIFLEHKSKTTGGIGQPGRDHDWVHTFTPGLRLNAGDAGARQSAYFDANYDAVFTEFTHHSGSDALDHNVSVALGGKLNRLSVAVEQKLQSQSDASQATLAANGRVKRKTWDTKVNTDYEVSEKTSTSLNLDQTIGDYNAPLVDSVDRSATLWLDYQVLPKVKAGIGAGIGYLQVDGTAANHNANSAYYNGQVRLDWKATEKLSINASGGVEYRNIQERGAKDPVGGIFSLGADWKAGEQTVVSLTASRGNKVSNALGAALDQATTFTASVRHGLWEGFAATLDGGYAMDHYKATSSSATVPLRTDNYFFVKPGLSYRFAERAEAKVFYQYRRNDADLPLNANDFYNTQVGLEVSYRF